MEHDDVRSSLRLHTGNFSKGNNRSDCRRRDGLSEFVNNKAPIRIAVEGQADVGRVLNHGALQVNDVRGLKRVGLVVGKRSVELEVKRNDLDRQWGKSRGGFEDGGNRESPHAVTRVDHDAQRPNRAQVYERTQVRGVIAQHIAFVNLAGAIVLGNVGVEKRNGPIANGCEPGVKADSLSTGTRELDAVVLGRVVTSRKHGGRSIPRARGVVGFVSRAEAQQRNVGSPSGSALSKSVRKTG